MSNTKFKNPWLKRHVADPYVKRAQQDGFRSRAAYKLLAIQEKDNLFKPGQTVLDLGAAPGAWSQVAKEKTSPKGQVISIDRLAMPFMEGVTFIQGDLEAPQTLETLCESLNSQRVDLVLSDMAPNLTGVSSIDQPSSHALVQLALQVAQQVLKKEGCFLVKCFHGKGFDSYFKELRHSFTKVVTRKPIASRTHSSEVYLLAKGYRL